MRYARFTLGSAIAAAIVSTPAPAAACGGASTFFPDEDEPMPLLLAQLHEFPADPTYVLPEPPQEVGLFLTAQHELAMGAVRSGGASGPWPAYAADERLQNVMWAVIVTQFHAAVRPDNPILWADAAEAAAAAPTLRALAHDILTDLHARDLIPHARGYALLAELQRDRGDDSGSELSLRDCRHLAKDDEACRIAGGPNA